MSIFRASKSEAAYFDMFIEFAQKAYESAKSLDELINDYTDIESKVQKIICQEQDCDKLVHAIMRKLNSSFVTPLDREDIDRIGHVMDNVVDGIEAAAQCFTMYNVKEIKEEAKAMSALIVRCTAELLQLMMELKRMKKSKTLQKYIIEINSIENEGDDVYRNALYKLFQNGTGTTEIVKWKDMFELLENTIDACEDVANIVEGVVMKHA
jgi:predicted phosphate transport protein (TIGR00153 family)